MLNGSCFLIQPGVRDFAHPKVSYISIGETLSESVVDHKTLKKH